MEDRMTAQLFRIVFEYLAENPHDRTRAMADNVWRFVEYHGISPAKLHCDDALCVLGVAERPASGQVTYRGQLPFLMEDGGPDGS